MARSQSQGFGGRSGLVNPRASIAGKLVAIAVLGVVVTMGAAVALSGGGDVMRAIFAGAVGSGVLVATLALVGFVTVGTLRDLTRKTEEISNGNYDVDLETSRRDEIGELANSIAIVRDDLRAHSNDIESLTRQITDIVQNQCGVMSQCGRGDLTLRMTTDTGIPQFDALAEDFNAMMRQTETAIVESKRFSEAVSVSANETTASITEVRNQIDDVIAATEEINQGVARQDQRFAEVAAEMSNLSASVEEVASSADELTEQSRETVETTHRGRDAAEDAIESLDTIRDQADDAVSAVADLERETDQIQEVVELIREIAEETNLLAVNAQIEAAHAGDVGEGFGIVADKIKTLSDDTAQAVQAIEDSLVDLQNSTDRTTRRIQDTQRSVERGTETIEEALGALDEIGEVVEATNVSIQQINDATRDQAETSEDVVRLIDEVAEISERTSTQAEEVVGITRRQRESISQVDQSVQTLPEQARNLNDSLERFTVSEGVASREATVSTD